MADTSTKADTADDADDAEHLLRLDITDDTSLAAALDALDAQTRQRLIAAVQVYIQQDVEADILRVVRETVAEAEAAEAEADPTAEHSSPVGVLFGANDWEDGTFLGERAKVLFADGTTTDCEFTIRAEFVRYGRIGIDATLAVDLRTGALEYDDYGATMSIHEHFGVAAPTPAP